MGFIEELRAALGPERVRTDPGDLRAVARDGSPLIGAPACLVYPERREHVEQAMQIASRARIPVVARGGGTSLAAGAIPPSGALVLAFNRMARVRALDVDERSALVEAGVTNMALDSEARRHGLRYAPDPSSRRVSMIGGNVATNAGGLHCLAHGVTTDHVLGLEVVLSDGTPVWLDADDDLDLRALVVGCEGTLAVVTAALLSLLPVPERIGMVVCGFAELEGAGAAAEAIIRAGVPAAALEYVERSMLDVIEHLAPGLYPAAGEAALVVEVESLADGLDEALERVESAVRDAGGSSRRVVDEAEQTQVWEARRRSGGAFGRVHPDSYTHDFAVPRDRIAEVLREIAAITDAHAVERITVAHLGDGNIHPKLLYDGREPGAYDRVIAASNAILELVLSREGTLSGEHGIGLEKLGAMGQQFAPGELDLMRAVRAAFDPHAILNPDKAIPLAGDTARRGVYAHA
ncbi:MAG TPA: FAD-linked oxidase C-terminal domain-containing protein [Gaiellales bacterium]|jgi:glycolate oxidase